MGNKAILNHSAVVTFLWEKRQFWTIVPWSPFPEFRIRSRGHDLPPLIYDFLFPLFHHFCLIMFLPFSPRLAHVWVDVCTRACSSAYIPMCNFWHRWNLIIDFIHSGLGQICIRQYAGNMIYQLIIIYSMPFLWWTWYAMFSEAYTWSSSLLLIYKKKFYILMPLKVKSLLLGFSVF